MNVIVNAGHGQAGHIHGRVENIPDNKVYGAYMGPHGTDRAQVGPMLAPWTLLSGLFLLWYVRGSRVQSDTRERIRLEGPEDPNLRYSRFRRSRFNTSGPDPLGFDWEGLAARRGTAGGHSCHPPP